MSLTKREYELLETIVAFGGYVTRGMVETYNPDITIRWANKILLSLAETRYIKCVGGFGKTQQNIYQVTFKTCKLFGQPHSHMRKKHGSTTIRRNLVRAHFLFQNIEPKDYLEVSSSEKRIKYLQSLGVDNMLIPRKINNGQEILQIEEPFLLLPPFAPDDGICVVLVDMIESDPSRQLRMMIDRYVPLIRSKVIPLSFLIVVEDTDRSDEYKDLYEKQILKKDPSKPKMNVFSIETTYNFCSKQV